jgi:hypothetical protein
MITEINEPIEVGAVFGEGAVSPVWFLWNGRRYRVERVAYRWREKRGESLLHLFSVFDGASTFELIYDSKGMRWRLGRVDLE